MNHFKNLLDGLMGLGAPAQRRTYPALKGFKDDAENLSGDARVVAVNLAIHAESALREIESVKANAGKGAKRRGTKLASHSS